MIFTVFYDVTDASFLELYDTHMRFLMFTSICRFNWI